MGKTLFYDPVQTNPANYTKTAAASSSKPQNTNLELRGFFKFKEEWYFSIFDKGKNKGVWLKKGDSFDDGKVEIESFNPDTEVVKLKGGFTLSLKKSENKIWQFLVGCQSRSQHLKQVPRQSQSLCLGK